MCVHVDQSFHKFSSQLFITSHALEFSFVVTVMLKHTLTPYIMFGTLPHVKS